MRLGLLKYKKFLKSTDSKVYNNILMFVTFQLPAYLFEKWADVANDDTELAKVRFYEDSR